MNIHFIHPNHTNTNNLSGLFFIIDGEIYIDSTTRAVKHNSHRNLYQTILETYPRVRDKYRLYPYLYFPRGFLLYESDIEKLMLGCPNELSIHQREALIVAFNHPIDREYLYMADDPHYNIAWLIARVHKVQTWSKDIMEAETEWFKSFYLNQIAQFKELTK
ncbi:hypothetical protein [Paracholeplasma manati]|uniref:hypothetical protein n=1 Tax=Paracholeplasma manati TaxID=591373 RepID=UPI0024082985|nr:hypothetical protein [Paracholeplasma manati]MDG0888301.1 hypothetical protein [Paracholeplasma manati]